MNYGVFVPFFFFFSSELYSLSLLEGIFVKQTFPCRRHIDTNTISAFDGLRTHNNDCGFHHFCVHHLSMKALHHITNRYRRTAGCGRPCIRAYRVYTPSSSHSAFRSDPSLNSRLSSLGIDSSVEPALPSSVYRSNPTYSAALAHPDPPSSPGNSEVWMEKIRLRNHNDEQECGRDGSEARRASLAV
jgi:hypothetical protein